MPICRELPFTSFNEWRQGGLEALILKLANPLAAWRQPRRLDRHRYVRDNDSSIEGVRSKTLCDHAVAANCTPDRRDARRYRNHRAELSGTMRPPVALTSRVVRLLGIMKACLASQSDATIKREHSPMRIPSPSSCFGQNFRISSSDIAWAILSPLLALYLRDFEVLSDERLKASIIYCLTTALFTILGFFIFRIHCGMARFFSVNDMIEVVKTVVFVEFATCLVLFSVTRLDGIPRSIPLVHGLLLATGLIAMRVIARFLFQEEFKSLGYRLQRNRIIMIGANRLAALYFELLSNYPGCAQCIIGVLDDSPETVGRAIGGVKILGTPQQLERIVREFAIHGVIVERVVVAGEEDFLHPRSCARFSNT